MRLLLALAALSLPAQTIIEPRVVSETLPAGGLMQIKVDFTSPHPITTSGANFTFDSAFDGVEGVAIMSPAGDAYGVATIQGSAFRANLVSPLASLGTLLDYPFLVIATKIRPGLAPGTVIPIRFGAGTNFYGPGGELYSMPLPKDGALTIGGSVSITNIVPGGGPLPAGATVRVLGTGFTPDTRLQINEITYGNVTYISPTEIRFTLSAPADLTGTRIIARNDDNSQATYFSYLRAVPAGYSGNALLNACHPLYPNATAATAGLSLNDPPPSGWLAIALRNTSQFTSAVRLDLVANGAVRASADLSLPSGAQFLRTAQELFGSIPPGSSIRVSASIPVQILGLRAENSNVSAFLPGAAPAVNSQLTLTPAVVVLDSAAPAKTVNVAATAAPLSFATASNSAAFSIAPGAPQTPAAIQIATVPAALLPGPQSGTLTFTPPDGSRSATATALVNVLPPAPGPAPIVGGAFPSGGSAVEKTFTFTFTDPNGWQDLDVVNVLIARFLDGRNACYLAYSRPANTLYLVNDAGNGLLPGLTLSGAGTLSNAQCVIDGARSSAAGAGNTLALTLHIRFTAAYAGDRVIYAAARDAANNSGWKPVGAWNIPAANPPQILAGPMAFQFQAALDPAARPDAPVPSLPDTANFTFTFSDPAGWQNLGVVNVLINDALDGRNACYLAYSRPLQTLYLVADNGGTLVPGLANSQCSIRPEDIRAEGAANTLTLSLRVTFARPAFSGFRLIHTAARTVAEVNSGWQAKGVFYLP